MRLEIFKGESDQWFVRLVGSNGETLMLSEAYFDKSNAARAAYNIADEMIDVQVKVLDGS